MNDAIRGVIRLNHKSIFAVGSKFNVGVISFGWERTFSIEFRCLKKTTLMECYFKSQMKGESRSMAFNQLF